MSERQVDYYHQRVLRLEGDKARLQTELCAARFDAAFERAMKRQIWALSLAMTIGTAVLIVVVALLIFGTRG